ERLGARPVLGTGGALSAATTSLMSGPPEAKTAWTFNVTRRLGLDKLEHITPWVNEEFLCRFSWLKFYVYYTAYPLKHYFHSSLYFSYMRLDVPERCTRTPQRAPA